VPSTEKSFGSEEEPVTAAALSEIAGQRLCNCCFNVLKNGQLFFFTRNHPVVLDGFAHLILVKL
jgi:hypothetical protein